MTLNSRLYPQIYEALGIDINNLGCIMLDIEQQDICSHVRGAERDLYYSPTLPWAQGAVGEKSAHLTVLYGLLEQGLVYKDHVDALLDGWNPEPLVVSGISYFPSNVPGEDYKVVVAKIEKTANLIEGHQRLQLLPHIDTFPAYKPHMTLAYIKGSADFEKWSNSLFECYSDVRLHATGINYGGDFK